MTNVAPPIRQRLPGLDVLRGIAVAAMIVYHFSWDLRFFRFIETDVVTHWFWAGLAKSIAGSFLLISGVSLAMAAVDGLDQGKFLKRLAVVGGAALLVTLGTVFAMPNAYIFFGILHCIALGSVLAIPFLRMPAAAPALVGLAVFVLPQVFTHPLFDAPLLRWTGLGPTFPVTNDYVPVFPWFGLMLIGVALGKLITAVPPAILAAEPKGVLALTARTGRLSLPIYLVHQPILLALLGAVSLAVPSAEPDRFTRDFRMSCNESCIKAGGNADFCPRYCACAEDGIRKADLWKPLLAGQLAAGQSQRIKGITEQCTATVRQ